MTISVAIEDVRREVKIYIAGHKNAVQFYEAYEDDSNVYLVMEQVHMFFFLLYC